MENNLSKFDLFDSMMSRLDVNPSVLTLDWLQHGNLSIVCVPSEISLGYSKQGVVGKMISFARHQEKKQKNIYQPTTSSLENLSPSDSVTEFAVAEKNDAQEFLFYDQNWKQLDAMFELNKRTLYQVRCGMFAYKHGSKVVICQKTLSSQKIRNQNYVFAGVVFELQEDYLLTLQFCAYKSNYSKALKRMIPENRLPSEEECEKIFIYQENFSQAFAKMNINFQKTEKIFHIKPKCESGKIGLFNFANGKSSASLIETAVADVYQVQTIKLK